MSENNILLKSILEELIKLNQNSKDPYFKEWYPLAFHFLQKGYQINTRYLGTGKWGFQQIWDKEPLYYDFDYEFDELHLWTENGNYKPAVKLIINGKVYPEHERFASSLSGDPYYFHRIFTGHNYNYMRSFQFSKIHNQQYGASEYPFKMVVKAEPKWSLNFQFFQTSTNNYWHYLMIFGWKLHKKKEDKIQDLQKVVEELNV